jgi:hypothetical protein
MMRRLYSYESKRWKTFANGLLNRLTGLPNVTIHYRADWRILADAHPMILILIEDSRRGERARHIAELWLQEHDR